VSLLTLAVPRDEARAPFDRANPLARLAVAFSLALPNVLVLDPVLAAATVVLAVATVRLTSRLPGWFVGRAAGVSALAAAAAGVANALGAAPDTPGGRAQVLFSSSLRVLAIVLPGVLAFATIDPADAADACVRQLRVRVRVAYGVLAAVRLAPLLAVDWQTMREAERARGVAGSGPVAALRRLGRRTVGLLVAALRRAGRMAVALDARGFDLLTERAAGDSPWRRSDTAWLLAGVSLAGLLLLTGVWLPFGRLALTG
jgi:energy-coupling factor transport system permease protein